MNINDGNVHKVLFSKGKLYLDETQIGGEGIVPDKDITFEFRTNNKQEIPVTPEGDPSVLEINVHDKVAGRSVGPGQMAETQKFPPDLTFEDNKWQYNNH